MPTHSIRLPRGEWEFDDQQRLGKIGGFGEVFRGRGEHGLVAVKRLKIDAEQAAHREMKIGDHLLSRDLKNVVPVLDAGQDAQSDRYYLVMPLCDCSLQDEIKQTSNGLSVETVVSIARSIIEGLLEVREITHRDLKPENILRHEGIWKIADFGIAKFVEDATSYATLRDSLTPMYAAPEQWLNERPTFATDVYALGCIVHALCTGNPPFVGGIEDLRHKHLTEVPSRIEKLPARLAAFVSHMLRKPQASRPTLERCRDVFNSPEVAQKGLSQARGRFLGAANIVADLEAKAEADRRREESLRRERLQLQETAKAELRNVRTRLFDEISGMADNVKVVAGNLHFGHAHFRMAESFRDLDAFFSEHSAVRNNGGWNVVTSTLLSVTTRSSYTWSASLIFAEGPKIEGFRWWEVAFWSMGGDMSNAPFGLWGDSPQLHRAFGTVLQTTNLAYGPIPIDGENENEFFDRWMGLVADAAVGKLRPPSTLPISLPRA